ncbi:MAG: inorganic diphosphatase [Clostridiales bacterium]|jgi:inorganic pyrophosphatase|nr:inorganic diphosphatase [Clostridiales bacterium]
MNIWHDLDKSRVTPESLTAVIEISKGSKMKYELDKKTGLLILDRVLYTATHYPANYGFIPRTYAKDGDPLDILVLCQEPITPLVLVNCYPIGVLKMIDDEAMDEKIIAIPHKDPSLSCYNDIHDLPVHLFQEIKHFFEVYKYLENKETVVEKIMGRDEALRVISECLVAYEETFGDNYTTNEANKSNNSKD